MNLNRRTFLTTTAASTLLGSKLGASVDKGEKSVIWLWLGGGISHIETVNPLPNGPSEYKSVTGHIQTNAGYYLGGTFEYMAKIGDKLTPVLSFTHRDANHNTATGEVMTGYPFSGLSDGSPQKEPAFGSIVSQLSAPNSNGVPIYTKINKITYDSNAWLGSQHTGFEVDGDGVKNLQLNIDKDRFNRRLDMVKQVDKKDDSLYRSWTNLRDEANKIITGKTSEIFNIGQESQETLSKYRFGKSKFCENLLLARRLVQAGSKFITVTNNGWDNHSELKHAFDVQSPDLDYGIYTLIEDLSKLDMLQNTLVVIATEFGRTPKRNIANSRDHWNSVVPLVFAGGRYAHGNIIGTQNDKGEYPTSKAITPSDLTNTIFDHLELDKTSVVVDSTSRPHHFITEDSRCILG